MRSAAIGVLVAALIVSAYALGRLQPETPRSDFKLGLLRAQLFSGGPERLFEDVGRQTLAKSISVGLMPDDTVLDVGAGSLRIGWWLLQYIEPENY